MVRLLIKYSIIFVVLVLLQVLVFNQIQFSGYINPYVYVLFILLLPINTPRYVVLLLGFLIGIVVDVFSSTLGFHAGSTVFMAFARASVLDLISSKEKDRSEFPGMAQYGFRWFLSYTAVMVVLHHVFFFYFEVFTFANFFHTLFRSFLSSVFSIFIIVLSQFIVVRD